MEVIMKNGMPGEMNFEEKEGAAVFRHTTSHILAQAVKRLYPDAKLAIGPAIDDGFYYDFDFSSPISSDDFAAIEKEMKKIVKERLKLERFTLPREEALALMKEKKEDYKVGLDPVGIKEMRELFCRLVQEREITILLSSHILSEMEHTADRIGVIVDGMVVQEIDPREIKKQYPNGMEDYFLAVTNGGKGNE